MHETARLPSSSIGGKYAALNTSRVLPRWLRLEFWLPVIAIVGFCLVVSADRGYAASGGEEVYNPAITSNFIRQLAFLSVGGTGMLMLVLARPAPTQTIIAWTILIPVLGLLGYVFASVLWSEDPVATMKRAITVALVVVGGIGIGRVWTMQDFAWGIITLSLIFLAMGIFVELQFRSFLSASEYRFSGLFHPAKQSFNCGFLLLASLAIYFTEGRRWVLVIAALALAFLILTKARTGTVAALVASTWMAWHYTSIRGWLIVGIAFLGLGISGILFYQGATGRELNATSIATMGRDEEKADPTKLTGRLPIWTYAFNEYSEQPVLGYGYGGYWSLGRLAKFERLNGWALYHSHSTYIESLLNLGLVGFILGLGTLAVVFHRSLLLRRQGNSLAILVGSILLMGFIGGFFEIAFIGLEYESFVPMIGIGVLTFAAPPQAKARR